MPRHYSTRDCFRQIPNTLLARYFASRGVLQDLDFAKMKETRVDPLFDAWMRLPEDARARMDGELREVFEMSDAKGTRAIIDEAEFQMSGDGEHAAFVTLLMRLPGHQERAMTVFLEYPQLWRGATRFHHADNLSFWRKRKHLPKKKVKTDADSLKQLATRISAYYQSAEGRGLHCVVEPYRRGQLDYFFAYPQDYAMQAVEWEGDSFQRRPHHPAFEIVFVYDQAEGRLDLNVSGSRKAVEPLQGIFADVILECAELPADPTDERVYDLNPLKNRDFSFTWDVSSGIEQVAINKLRLSLLRGQGQKVTLEASPGGDGKGVYALLDKLAPALKAKDYHITQVGISARVRHEASGQTKTVPFQLTHPNSCSLKYDEIGLKLRAMLSASQIEPRAPGVDAAAASAECVDAEQLE